MIPRYTRAEMAQIWDEEERLKIWLEIEVLAIEARAEIGEIAKSVAEQIRKKAGFSLKEVKEREEVTRHDVAGFVDVVGTRLGELSRYLHLGMTSSDLLDSAFSVQLVRASNLLLKDLDRVLSALKNKTLEHKYTVLVGRTHGMHAEPISFGLVLARFYEEFRRARARLELAREEVRVGKVSGAVGDYFHLDPRIEEYVMKGLGLKPESISSQIIPRDRYGYFFQVLALIGTSVEHLSLQVRHFQRSEVGEAEEFFSVGQKGSSAMPHKRNPVLSENLTGLARLVRAYALTALENIPLWHERDISHSSAERIIAPDACIALDFMLSRLAGIIEKLLVYPEQMEKNLWLTRGLVFSEGVMLKLMERGMSREQAYGLVQRCAMECLSDKEKSFLEVLESEPEVKKFLTQEELKRCFDLESLKVKIDYIFEKIFVS